MAVVKRFPVGSSESWPPFPQEDEKNYPALEERFAHLDAHLVPVFSNQDAEAQKQQKSYRRFGLLLILGAMVASVLGAIQAAGESAEVGLVLALVAAATGVVTTVDKQLNPLQKYLRARAKAEELRSLYFRYLGGLGITDEQGLEEAIARSGSGRSSKMATDDEFLKAYNKHRVGDQIHFYESRVSEYGSADDQAVIVRALLLFGAAACGAFGAFNTDFVEAMGLLAAALAALAAVATAWSDLVGFRLNHDLYDNARGALEMLRPRRPKAGASLEDVQTYVDAAEDIMLGEVRTWGEKWQQKSDEREQGEGKVGGGG